MKAFNLYMLLTDVQVNKRMIKMFSRFQRVGTRSLLCRGYHENVISHYENPRNVGSLPKDDPDVGYGLVGSMACGDLMGLSIRVDKDSGTITDAKFRCFGCGSAIAASSYATEVIKGVPVKEALEVTNRQISEYMHAPAIKLHCSALAEDAIKAAVKDWKDKQNSS